MTITDITATIRQNIEEARAKLSFNVLVGQGFICAIEDGSMAVARNGETFRLHPVQGHLCGVSHWTREDAEKVAAHWNSNPAAQANKLTVSPVHYRDALEANLAKWESLLEDLT
jgi:hypothetical protein